MCMLILCKDTLETSFFLQSISGSEANMNIFIKDPIASMRMV